MSFEEKLEEYKDPLIGRALKLTENEFDAEDLVQETYYKALTNKEKFEPGTNLKAWLFTILRNTFLSGRRKQNRRRDILSEKKEYHKDQKEHMISDGEKGLMGEIEVEELMNLIQGKIKEKYYSVLFLCDVKDLTYKEISQNLEIPLGTVMSRLHRARKNARKILIEEYNKNIIEEYGVNLKEFELEAA